MLKLEDILTFISGNGYGYGNGNGNGYGDGDGDGNGNGKLILKNVRYIRNARGVISRTALSVPVFYIDSIPTVFHRIKNNVAYGGIVNAKGLFIEPCFVAKFSGYFAHGATAKKAILDAEAKFYQNLDLEIKLSDFKSKFNKGVEYDNQLYFDWHFILTGSCLMGRTRFLKERTYKYDANKNGEAVKVYGKMTPESFLTLIRGEFGWDKISSLDNYYNTLEEESRC